MNLAFVIDRSGSMHGDKIDYARRAVALGIRSLREGDRFAVVAYDDAIELVARTAAALAPRQGKRAEAQALLAPVYCWFREGFDTADLQEARTLLDVLR